MSCAVPQAERCQRRLGDQIAFNRVKRRPAAAEGKGLRARRLRLRSVELEAFAICRLSLLLQILGAELEQGREGLGEVFKEDLVITGVEVNVPIKKGTTYINNQKTHLQR